MPSTAEGWDDPDRWRRYRARVSNEQAGLRAACARPAQCQDEVLRHLLEFNADTEFGRKYSFDRIRGLADFRRAMPIHDYSALAPWIERMAAGERRLLTADDPLVYFTSSGTTGSHKKIPVTPQFARTVFMPFYHAMWAPLVEHFGAAVRRPDALLNLKQDLRAAPPTTSSGRPHVGSSQVDLAGLFGEPLSAEPGTAAPWAALPATVSVDDHLERMYLRLRLAVEHQDLRGVITFNPAMVAALPDQLTLWWPRILQEVRDGTLGGRPHGWPNPARAAELEWLAARFDPVLPAHVWPHLEVLLCWTTGVASLYLPRVREQYGPAVTVLPAPVGASEGPVGVALDRHPSAGALVLTASVLEFADADADLRPDSDTLLPEELEPGRDYHVLHSHVGGLYRYAVGDVVRVLDVVGGVPRVEYAGRRTLSDVAGERLREAQVVRALTAALAAGGLEVRNAAVRPETPGDGAEARYAFAVEPRGRWTATEQTVLAGRLDDALATQSPAYRDTRARGRLAPPVVRRLPDGAFAGEWHDAVAAGVRPTQVKDRLFRQDPDQWRRLLTRGRDNRTDNEETT
jgi:hypothetical protein